MFFAPPPSRISPLFSRRFVLCSAIVSVPFDLEANNYSIGLRNGALPQIAEAAILQHDNIICIIFHFNFKFQREKRNDFFFPIF